MKKIILEKVINLVREQLASGAGAPTNNVGSGHIAGTVEAGDSPPVHKRKKQYWSGGRGARKQWMKKDASK